MLPDDAVILVFHIPYTRPREYVQTHRVARRPQMSHPIVNAGLRVRLDDRGHVEPGEVTIVFGGLAPMIVRAERTEQFLAGKPWDRETLRAALDVLSEEVREWTERCPRSTRRGSAATIAGSWRRTSSTSSFLHVAAAVDPDQVAPEHVSAAEPSRPAAVHRGRRNTPSIPSSIP